MILINLSFILSIVSAGIEDYKDDIIILNDAVDAYEAFAMCKEYGSPLTHNTVPEIPWLYSICGGDATNNRGRAHAPRYISATNHNQYIKDSGATLCDIGVWCTDICLTSKSDGADYHSCSAELKCIYCPQQKTCPLGDKWIPCTSSGGTCEISAGKTGLISYGIKDFNLIPYRTNGRSLKFKCDAQSGDPAPGVTKFCCYKSGKNDFKLPENYAYGIDISQNGNYESDGFYTMAYGYKDTNSMIFRAFYGSRAECLSSFMGDPHFGTSAANKACKISENNKPAIEPPSAATAKWVYCGTQSDGKCYLDEATNEYFWVKYGDMNENKWNYRYMYSDDGVIPCNTNLFSNPTPNIWKTCYYLDPIGACNWGCYLQRYPDLSAAYGCNFDGAKQHYQLHGINEGRNCLCDDPNACNWQCYLNNYQDLMDFYGCDIIKAEAHYNIFGQNEGRNCQCNSNIQPITNNKKPIFNKPSLPSTPSSPSSLWRINLSSTWIIGGFIAIILILLINIFCLIITCNRDQARKNNYLSVKYFDSEYDSQNNQINV